MHQDLAGEVAHDIRKVLASGYLAAEALSEAQDERTRRLARRSLRSIERAVELVALLERPDRPRSWQLDDGATVPLDAVLSEAIALGVPPWVTLRRVAAGRCAPVELAARHRLVVLRILVNLLTNGAAALRRAGPDAARPGRGALHVASGSHAGHPWIEIADDGPGLPAEVAAGLRHGSRRRGDGRAGQGLGIALGLARSVGGRLSLVETGGHGTRFRLDLPRPFLVPDAPGGARAPAEAAAGPGGAGAAADQDRAGAGGSVAPGAVSCRRSER